MHIQRLLKMLKVSMVRSLTGLSLAPWEAADALRDLPHRQVVNVQITSPSKRSSGFHRRYFAMIGVAQEHGSDECRAMTQDAFRKWMQIAVGSADVAPDGTVIPRSIRFEKMDQDEFRRLYQDTLSYCLLHVLPTGVTGADLDAAVDELLSFG